MAYYYIISTKDNESITEKTGVSVLKVKLTNPIKETWGVPIIMYYDKNDTPNPESITSPGIFIYIDQLNKDSFIDGEGRVFNYELIRDESLE